MLLISCQRTPKFESPEGYDFSSPEKILMKEALLEISGITFHQERPDTLLAINDESGKLFYFTQDDLKPHTVKFAGDGDYEDVAVYKDSIFVLRSDGSLFSLPDSLSQQKTISSIRKKVFPKAEYESIYIDDKSGILYVLCKQYSKKKNKNLLLGYSLDLKDSTNTVNPFAIDLNPIIDKKNKKQFLPSAMAKNLLTGEWFIVSSANKFFLITDKNFKPKKIFALDPAYFIQPEGMAFDSQNNLYISNEGNDLRNGNILKFSYQGKIE
jgi:hypothetical protein